MFAYCRNNPVNMQDDSGYWPKWSNILSGSANIAAGVFTIGFAATLCTNPLGWAVGLAIGAHGLQSTIAGVGNLLDRDWNVEKKGMCKLLGNKYGSLAYDVLDLGISAVGLGATCKGISKGSSIVTECYLETNLKFGMKVAMPKYAKTSKIVTQSADITLGARSIKNDIVSIQNSSTATSSSVGYGGGVRAYAMIN